MENSSAGAWAMHEFESADFHDARLTKRCVATAASFLQHAQSSIPQASNGWAATKATYRFFANSKVQSETMLAAHHTDLLGKIEVLPTVLVAQDTMTLNLSNKQIAGIGSIGNGGSSGTLRGLFVHSALAMTTAGIPLGLTYQKIYARRDGTKTDAYRKTAKSLPIQNKESGRWVEAIECTKQVLHEEKVSAPDTRIVMIGDRESDIYEVFRAGQELGIDLLVRTSQNRNLKDEADESTVKLFDKVRTGLVVTSYDTDIPVDHQKTRRATLTIRTSRVTIQRAKARHRKGVLSPPITLTVLNVREEHPQAGVEPIYWMLSTSLSVLTVEEAIEKVTWYVYRWRIERFHFTLKTGAFNIEKLQFETLIRFAKAITMYSLVAVRVLHGLYYGRDHPNEDAGSLFSAAEIQALILREKKITTSLSIDAALKATAKLGGHLGRKLDGPPGIKTLWKGFQTLRYLVEGMQLAQRAAEARRAN